MHRAEEARLRREEPLGEGVGGEVRRVGGRQAVHARRHLVLGQEALRVGHQVQAYKGRNMIMYEVLRERFSDVLFISR